MTKYSLFFIDDDVKYANQILTSLPGPWTIFSTSSTNAALKVFEERPFDIYVIDLKLMEESPSNTMNGDDLFIKLKKMGTFSKSSPVVIYTESIARSQIQAAVGSSQKWAPAFDYYQMTRQHRIQDFSDALVEVLKYHRRA